MRISTGIGHLSGGDAHAACRTARQEGRDGVCMDTIGGGKGGVYGADRSGRHGIGMAHESRLCAGPVCESCVSGVFEFGW